MEPLQHYKRRVKAPMVGYMWQALFHVEQLFPDAESPEQSVEHLLDPGAPGDSVKRRRGEPKPFGEQD